jgi:hypothetical protein
MHSERDIDDAIDRVVREIMSAEPRAGLRGRVLADLESGHTKRLSILRLASVAALVCLAAFIFLRVRPPSETDAPQTVADNTRPAAVAPASPAAVPSPPPVDAARAPRTSAPAATRAARPARLPQFPARGTVAAASVAADSTAPIPVLEHAASLPFTAQAPEIAIHTIRIEPLTIDRIVIAPLSPPR